MIKKIIKIDKSKCNGCGDCVTACHEGAIELIDGKATLTREDYCDGLGDCLPACRAGAITFTEKEIPTHSRAATGASQTPELRDTGSVHSTHLMQWPCKLRLIPTFAPYLDGADLLIAADCAAFAHGAFHGAFMKNRVTLTVCPKFENIDYKEKLRQIILGNNIKSVTVARMEVPCCGGAERAVEEILNSIKNTIPYKIVTISTSGKILNIRDFS